MYDFNISKYTFMVSKFICSAADHDFTGALLREIIYIFNNFKFYNNFKTYKATKVFVFIVNNPW